MLKFSLVENNQCEYLQTWKSAGTSEDKLDCVIDDKLTKSTWRKRSSNCENYYHFYSWYFQI